MKFLLLTFLSIQIVMAGEAQVKSGHEAPDLMLPDLNDTMARLSDLRGKVVLIDFWASWCGPCRRNNPHLVAIYKKFHQKGFEIFGVSIDDDKEAWKKAVGQDGLSWIQVNDQKGWNAPSVISYDIEAIPASFLLDKNGHVRNVDLVGRRLELAIETLLKEKQD